MEAQALRQYKVSACAKQATMYNDITLCSVEGWLLAAALVAVVPASAVPADVSQTFTIVEHNSIHPVSVAHFP